MKPIYASLLAITLIPLNVQAHDKQLSFIENIGQVTDQDLKARKDIQFSMQTAGMSVFVGDGQLHYQWYQQTGNFDPGSIDALRKPNTVNGYRMDVVLLGANTDAQIVKEEQQDYEQYYMPHLGLNGEKAFTYQKVTYRNIYPHIDMVLYSRSNELKYDFIVHAGGDPANIKLQYNGTTGLKLKDDGLVAETPMGTVKEDKPYTYDAATKREIASSFVLNGNVLSFNVPAANGTMVIDPAIQWITYYGGPEQVSTELSMGLATDAAGNAYWGGMTQATTTIATSGAFQSTLFAWWDAYLVKFNAAGVRQWATYFGGYDVDYFTGVAVDNAGNIYAAGIANEPGMATPGAYNENWSSDDYTILAKFNNSGARQWSTYFEKTITPSQWNTVQLCCDPSGNLFMHYCGIGNPQVPQFRVQKFTTAAGMPQWKTTWKSNALDRVTGMASDVSGNIYVCGTLSGIGYFARLNSSGTKNLDITYNSGTAHGIAADAAGNIYLSGMTQAAGIATSGTSRTTLGTGTYDGYLSKYNSTGTKLWTTYIGPASGNNYYCRVVTGLPGKLYVSGGDVNTNSPYFISGINSNDGTGFTTLNLPGNKGQMSYSNLAWSPSGMLYMTGMTQSNTGFGTSNAYKDTLSGPADPYLAAIRLDTGVFIQQPFTDTVLCAGSSFQLSYDVSFSYNAGNVFTAWLSDASGSFVSPVNIGSTTSATGGIINCTIPLSTSSGTGYRIRISATNPFYISPDNDVNIKIDNAIVPAVLSFTATPGVNVGIWTPITFTVTTYGGGTPVYIWRKNGAVISGATGSSYTGVTGIDLVTGDTITVSFASSLDCASPDTAFSPPLVINVNTGVSDLNTGEVWELYPNPTSGRLSFTMPEGTNAVAEIMNMTGQVIFTTHIDAGKPTIELDGALSNGLYLIRLNTGDTTKVMRFCLER